MKEVERGGDNGMRPGATLEDDEVRLAASSLSKRHALIVYPLPDPTSSHRIHCLMACFSRRVVYMWREDASCVWEDMRATVKEARLESEAIYWRLYAAETGARYF